MNLDFDPKAFMARMRKTGVAKSAIPMKQSQINSAAHKHNRKRKMKRKRNGYAAGLAIDGLAASAASWVCSAVDSVEASTGAAHKHNRKRKTAG
jgi:hypothetical protein